MGLFSQFCKVVEDKWNEVKTVQGKTKHSQSQDSIKRVNQDIIKI